MKKENKHICHLTSVHPTFDIRVFHKECVSLANSGFKVSLIAPATKQETKNGVTIIPIQLPKNRIKRMLVVTFKMLVKAIKQKAKIYHFHDPELMFCGVLLSIFGKKVIYDIHENVRLSLSAKKWIPKWLVGITKVSYFMVERFSILFFCKLILAETSYQKYYPKKKSIIVLNYPMPVPNKIQIKTFNTPLRFVYSGVVHSLRGVWQMIEIVKKITDLNYNVTLDMIGELRPKELKDDVFKYLKINNLTNTVNIHGKVDFSKISSFLQQADIGFSLLKDIPNYKESLPTKIFEYMQHGLPVITNDFELLKHYVDENKVGICISFNDIADEINKITDLIKNTDRMKQMSENGIRLTTEEWNWSTQANKLIEIYKQILDI